MMQMRRTVRRALGEGQCVVSGQWVDVALLVTDIVGSTALWDDDPMAMSRALRHHDLLVRRAVAAHGGRLVKAHCGGDGTLSVFRSPCDAAGAATTLQHQLAATSWPTSRPLQVRAAVHLGTAEQRDGDYLGPDVNLCARLCEQAAGGTVLVSAAAAALLPDVGTLHDLRLAVLRGTRPTGVFELVSLPEPT